MVNKDNMKTVINFLRNPVYDGFTFKQIRFQESDGYGGLCALGVVNYLAGQIGNMRKTTCPGIQVGMGKEWLEIPEEDLRAFYSIMNLNDSEGYTFKQIADYLDRRFIHNEIVNIPISNVNKELVKNV